MYNICVSVTDWERDQAHSVLRAVYIPAPDSFCNYTEQLLSFHDTYFAWFSLEDTQTLQLLWKVYIHVFTVRGPNTSMEAASFRSKCSQGTPWWVWEWDYWDSHTCIPQDMSGNNNRSLHCTRRFTAHCVYILIMHVYTIARHVCLSVYSRSRCSHNTFIVPLWLATVFSSFKDRKFKITMSHL